MQYAFVHPNFLLSGILWRHNAQKLKENHKNRQKLSKHCDFNRDLTFLISDTIIFSFFHLSPFAASSSDYKANNY